MSVITFLKTEKESVSENLIRLNVFIDSNEFMELDQADQKLLFKQKKVMGKYLRILQQRFDKMNTERVGIGFNEISHTAVDNLFKTAGIERFDLDGDGMKRFKSRQKGASEFVSNELFKDAKKYITSKNPVAILDGIGGELLSPIEEEKKDTPSPFVSFDNALKRLNDGGAVAREKMYYQGGFIYKQVPAKINADFVHKMTSVPNPIKDLMLDRQQGFDYNNQCVIVDINGGVTYWNVSHEDLFANDWILL